MPGEDTLQIKYVPFTRTPWEGHVLKSDASGLADALTGTAEGEMRTGGRGEVALVTLGGRRYVVRKYRRGGMMRLFGDRYLHNRAEAEFLLTHRLYEAGLPVAEPAGVAWRRSGIFLRGVLATRWVEGQDLDSYLRSGVDETLMREVGGLFRRMHDEGVYHADLQVKNVRITPHGPVLLDFDNARHLPRPLTALHCVRNLLRFKRSLEKNALPRHYFSSILAGYGAIQIPRWLQLSYTIKGRLSDLLSGRRTNA